MAQIPKGRLVKGPYKTVCRDCAIYFSNTVTCLSCCNEAIPRCSMDWSICIPPTNMVLRILVPTLLLITHTIHVWYIYLHLVDFDGKCREIYHTWMIWVIKPGVRTTTANHCLRWRSWGYRTFSEVPWGSMSDVVRFVAWKHAWLPLPVIKSKGYI